MNQNDDHKRQWQDVLDKIEKETGLSGYSQFETEDKDIAAAVLPVLVECARVVDNPNTRRTIYLHFLTPHASPFVGHLLEWLQKQESELSVEILTQALAIAVTTSDDADKVWALYQGRNDRAPSDYALFARLSEFMNVGDEVKNRLLKDLQQRKLSIGQLEDISKVDDTRIRDWFKAQMFSEDRNVRNLARRVARRGTPLPKGFRFQETEPDRTNEVFSAVVDIDDLKVLLKQLSEETPFEFPKNLRSVEFVSRLDRDRWIVTQTTTKAGDRLSIWLRLEDLDTVEVALTKP